MKQQIDLLLVLGLTLLHGLLVALQVTGPVRVVTGFLFVSLLPGYALLAAVYRPARPRFGVLEHVALAIPVSLALSATLGLGLNLVGFGLQAQWQVAWMGTLTMGCALWAVQEQPAREQPARVLLVWGIVLVSAVLLAAGVFSPTASPNDSFASLYLLHADGETLAYPQRAAVGEPIAVTVGGTYRGETAVSAQLIAPDGRAELIVLQPGEQWQRETAVVLSESGVRLLTWRLVSVDGNFSERSVHLWIDSDAKDDISLE